VVLNRRSALQQLDASTSRECGWSPSKFPETMRSLSCTSIVPCTIGFVLATHNLGSYSGHLCCLRLPLSLYLLKAQLLASAVRLSGLLPLSFCLPHSLGKAHARLCFSGSAPLPQSVPKVISDRGKYISDVIHSLPTL
jgi:hypothetical protein